MVNDALRAHLAEGEKQAESGELIEDFSMTALIQELDDKTEFASWPNKEGSGCIPFSAIK